MKPVECPREQETVRHLLSRRGLECADAGLRSHIEGCAVCTDAVMLASLLGSDRDDALRDVHVPAAGQVWWRAALRAHADASDAARRPLIWLQGIAGACAVALVAALVSLAWPSIYDAVVVMAALRPDVTPLIEAVRPVMPIALTVLACLVVTPIVVYFALSDD